MDTRKSAGGRPWTDPDDAPELTKEFFQRADVYDGEKLVRRGRPKSENPKQVVKLRLPAAVVEHFRAGGPGWQTRIGEVLERLVTKEAAGARSRKVLASASPKIPPGKTSGTKSRITPKA